MATLIHEISSGGRQRRCDANCYNAKTPKCDCVCGGANHGKGLVQALRGQAQRFGKGVVKHTTSDPVDSGLFAQTGGASCS